MKKSIKKIAAMLTALSMLAGLGACGEKNESVSAPVSESAGSVAPVEVQTLGDYIIPSSWTQNSIDDGNFAYVTEAAESDGSYETDELGHLYCQEDDAEQQTITVSVCNGDGDALYSVRVPYLQPVTDPANQGDYLTACVPLDDCLWVVHDHVSHDPETETDDGETVLQQWDTQGNLTRSVPVSDFDVNGQDSFVLDLAAGENGELLLVLSGAIVFLDETGTEIARQETEQDAWYRVRRDSGGRCYFMNEGVSTELYTVDWENHALGQLVLETSENGTLQAGGGDYDFFLVGSDKLMGLSLSAGTMTEILRWESCGLTGSVSRVEYVDEEQFLVTVGSMLSEGERLYLRRVPASEVPEKTALYLAVPLVYYEDMPDRDWSESLDQMITEEMNIFNRNSGEYQLQVVTYTSASDLQLLMQSDNPPDLICWDGDWLEQPPSAQIYGAKGYLVDLEPLVEADSELNMSDFIPRCIELLKETYGGLYLFPKEFYGTAVMAKKEYVGDIENWTLEDFCRIAEALPEGVQVWDVSGRDLLEMLLQTGMGEFVDYQAGTCNFETQEFYDLLNVCRDKCPQEEGNADGDYLITGAQAIFGCYGQFAEELMVPAREQGLTMIGYPGARGNGMNLTFRGMLSITVSSPHQEAAWSFLRELMTYEFQTNGHPMTSMRQDAFNEKEDRYAAMYPDAVSAEDYAAVKELPYDAGSTTVYDSPPEQIILEESQAFFAGDKTAEDTAKIIQNRVSIYLGEQS